MPIIIFRHGTTSKNLTGAVDDLDTPLDQLGHAQAKKVGIKFRDFCRQNGIAHVMPVTSGAVRTEQTAQLVIDALGQLDLIIAPMVKDFRLGEIKFRDRLYPATPETPGLFGRQIDYFGNEIGVNDAGFVQWKADFDHRTRQQGVLAALDAQYKAIVGDWLSHDIAADTVLAFFIHNTSSRRLMVEYTGQPLSTMEQIVVGNCAMIELRGRDIVWHDQGILTEREKKKAQERGS